MTRTCKALLLSLCGKSQKGGRSSAGARSVESGHREDGMMKAPLASRSDPDCLRWWCRARTHTCTQPHTHPLSRIGAVHRFVSTLLVTNSPLPMPNTKYKMLATPQLSD